MPDFPNSGVLAPKICINAGGPMTMLWDWCDIINLVSTTGAVWPVASKALFCAFAVEFPVLAQKMAVQVTTQAGNIDMGIYDEKGNRIVSKGTTATAAAGLQVLDITDTLLLPGTYYMAMACDSATAAFARLNPTTALSRIMGLQEMATAFVLPATATFANPAAGYFPNLSIQCSAVI